MRHHDLVVIGTGSGNSVIDDGMADWDIGIVDQRRTGGTWGDVRDRVFGLTDRIVIANRGRPVIPPVVAEPPMGSVGLTEGQCRDRHPDHLVGRKPHSEMAYGWTMQEGDGFCKVLLDGNTDLIPGAHVIGPQAATLIHVFVVAIEFGIAATDLARRPYWIHPAMTEVVQNALLDVSAAA